MKRRGHIYPFICLMTITLSLAAAAVAGAQGFMPPPPGPVPSVQPYPLEAPFVPAPPGTRPSLMAGRFYFQGGVKYRSIESLRFNVFGNRQSLIANPGTVPFGPATAGDFGVGTGKDGFLGGAGVCWVYDNGQICGTPDPGGGGAVAVGCGAALTPAIPVICDNAGVDTYCACDYVYTYDVVTPLVGRRHSTGAGGCCDGLDVASSVGSFSLTDAISQVNNTNVGNTTAVTLQLALLDSLAFVVDTTPAWNRQTGAKLWSPSFEAGYQISNFFDLFSTFSWFSVSQSTGISNVIVGQGARVAIRDTFPFSSDDFESNWPAFNFNSSSTCIVGAGCFQAYEIAVNSALRGVFPNRTFTTQLDATVPAESIQETVSSRVDINVYETRLGGRSWVPLFGLGRLGVTFGGSFMPAYYKIAQNRNYVSLGPNVPGQVLFSVSNEFKDWRPHYGVFVGSDLELGNGIYYIQGSIDYTWVNNQTYTLDAVETSFNPGGMSVGAMAGLHF